jgi:hypothetical protein
MMIDGETEVRDLKSPDAPRHGVVQKAVLRLLQDGEVHPQLVVLAVAWLRYRMMAPLCW